MAENVEEYKGYNLGPTEGYPMFVIKARGQGMVPAALQGLYTTMPQAKGAVDSYLTSLKKGKKNVKTKSTSTG